MNDEELSIAIAKMVNGLAEEYGEGDPMRMMNATANIMNYCLCNIALNLGNKAACGVIVRQMNELSQRELMEDGHHG